MKVWGVLPCVTSFVVGAIVFLGQCSPVLGQSTNTPVSSELSAAEDSAAEDSAAEDAEPEGYKYAASETAVPVYDYSRGAVQEWLLLGPIPKDRRPENPRDLLDDLLNGVDTYWVDEHRYQWTPVRSDPTGEVWLNTFCRDHRLRAAHSVVYAVCRMAPNDDQERQYFFGVDDSGTVWLGDNEPIHQPGPDWHEWNNVTTQLALDPSKQNYCFAELGNSYGRFTFSLHCGRTMTGVATSWDGQTPRDWVVVEARSPDGEQICETYSQTNGRFTLEPIPYDVDLQLGVLGAVSDVSTDAAGQTRIRVGKGHEPVTRVIGLREKGAKKVTAVDVAESGHILFATGLNGEIHRSIGNQTERFLKQDLGQISVLQCRSGGELDMLQSDGGYLCWSESPWQFAGTPVEGFTYSGGAGCTVDCFTRDPDGSLWVATTDPGPPERQHEILHLSTDGRILSRIKQRMGVTGIAVDEANVYVGFDLGIVDIIPHGQRNFVLPNTHVALVVGLKLEAIGGGKNRLWVIGTDATCYLNDDNTWTRLKSPIDTRVLDSRMLFNTQLGRLCLWHDAVFCMRGDDWLRVVTDESLTCIARTPTGTVLAGTASGRLLEVHQADYEVFSIEDGLSETWMIQTQEVDGDLLVSTYNQPPRWLRSDGSVDELDSLSTDMHVYLGNGEYLRAPRLYSNYQVDKPYSRDDVEIFKLDGTSESLGKPGDLDVLFYTCLCPLLDGSILLGTNYGVYEITPERTLNVKTGPDGLPMLNGNEVVRLFECPDGKIWFNDNDKRFGWWDPATGESKFTPHASDSLRATSFAKAADGPMYVGTENGLYTIDEQTLELSRTGGQTIGTAQIDEVLIDKQGRVWASTPHDGVYSLSEGVWLKLTGIKELEDSAVRLTDIELGADDTLWICLDDKVIKYRPSNEQPVLLLDSVVADGQELANLDQSISDGVITVEEGTLLDLRMSSWDNSRISAYRYRTHPDSDWQYVPNRGSVQIPVGGSGKRTIQMQAVDRDHNFSNAFSIAATTYLPWYRSTALRFLAGFLCAFALATSAFSGYRMTVARRRQLSAERSARESAEQRVAEREHLLQRVSHDLRNPIFVIGGCAEMVQSGELGEVEAFRILQETADSMEYLTNQLLSYSRAKAERLAQDTKTVAVRDVLESVCSKAQLVFRDSTNRLEVEIASGVPRILHLPLNATQEILQNLVSNAIKNTANGTVTLAYNIDDGLPTIQVRDTGCGMSREFTDKAFEPFVRQPSAAKESGRVSGFGLGLSICKLLASEIGASLGVESEMGAGTTVSLQFPKNVLTEDMEAEGTIESRNAASATSADTTPRPHLAFGKATCLVVDDVPFVRETTVHRLAGAGIVAVDCGPNNLPPLTGSGIRVVLTDLEMPATNGFQLADRLCKQHPEIAIIAYSERGDLIDAARQSDWFAAVFSKADVLSNQPRAIEAITKLAHVAALANRKD